MVTNQQKVTNYELSKELSECGFESETHMGWYIRYGFEVFTKKPKYVWSDHKVWIDEHTEPDTVEPIKAYDTWDLLMWLNKYRSQYYKELSIHGCLDHGLFNCPIGSDTNRSPQPQNALAMAIIKILKEEKK